MDYLKDEKTNYLAHYGIKGQQYGVRRYQNEDGTLTPEGKQRYLSGPNYSKKYDPINEYDGSIEKNNGSKLSDTEYKQLRDTMSIADKDKYDALQKQASNSKKLGNLTRDRLKSKRNLLKSLIKGAAISPFAPAVATGITIGGAYKRIKDKKNLNKLVGTEGISDAIKNKDFWNPSKYTKRKESEYGAAKDEADAILLKYLKKKK